MEKIKIVLADDHVIIRKSLKSFINSYPDMEVVGEADNGSLLIELLKTITPDIVLLDVEMPVMSGADALKIINQSFPNVKVVVLSMHDQMNLVYELMLCGARAYLPKASDAECMEKTIRVVNEFGYYFSDSVSRLLRSSSMFRDALRPIPHNVILTTRELQVLQLICLGMTNKQIGAELSITPRTVDFHRKNLYVKTQTSTLAGLIRYSIRQGLTGMHDQLVREQLSAH